MMEEKGTRKRRVGRKTSYVQDGSDSISLYIMAM